MEIFLISAALAVVMLIGDGGGKGGGGGGGMVLHERLKCQSKKKIINPVLCYSEETVISLI